MKLYSTYFHPRDSTRADQPPVLVKEGISWPCLIFGWVGLLVAGSWIGALLVAAAGFALVLMLRPMTGVWPILVGARLLLAFFANDLRCWELRLRGFMPGPLVSGRNSDSALVRLLDRQPELLGQRA